MMKTGRPKTSQSRTTTTKPLLITVYRVNYPGLEQVQQYYKYDFGDNSESFRVDSCPGCGKDLKYRAMEHKCSGTLTDMPVNNKFRDRPLGRPKKLKDQELQHYVSSATHPIHLSD